MSDNLRNLREPTDRPLRCKGYRRLPESDRCVVFCFNRDVTGAEMHLLFLTMQQAAIQIPGAVTAPEATAPEEPSGGPDAV